MMMNINQKRIQKVLKGVAAALPALPYIPYIMRSRRRPSVTAYVLGGVGFAIAGGIAALMFFSPRTRTRVLTAAKDTYDKANDKISHIREDVKHEVGSLTNGLSNGIAEHHDVTTQSDFGGTSSTGL